MAQEPKSGMSATSIILIIFGAIGLVVVVCAGVIVVCLVAITALGTSANATFGTVGNKIGVPESQRPPLHGSAEAAAKEFVTDLCAGLTQAAWDDISAEFQNRHRKVGGPDQSKYFADFLQEHPGLRNANTIQVKSQNVDPSQPTVQATITTKSGEKIILHLKLVKEKETETYKVSDLSVDDKKERGAEKKQ